MCGEVDKERVSDGRAHGSQQRAPEALPSGTVTFLFTDLEGSTRRWEADPEGMATAVARHLELLESAIAARGGFVFAHMGDGIAAAFGTGRDAVMAAVEAQKAMGSEEWGGEGPLRARMGVHSGEGKVIGNQYESHTPNRCARLMAAAHGGQLLVSGSTYELLRGALPPEVELVDLGEHRLRDLQSPMRVYQVRAPGLAPTFPPLRSVDGLSRSIPEPLDHFVGRVDELRDVVEQLGQVRLLTLFGPGGIGKTRLAVEAAHASLADFDDRVVFVDLSASRDVASVLLAIARAIGAQEQSDRPVLRVIQERIGGQRTLLILDNLEQVTESAPTLAELLGNCSALTILATSREALHIAGEQIYVVPPLRLPADDVDGSISALAESEAVQFFVDRARAVRPDFDLDAENAAAVRELCARLDGLPLAIELAAARLALLPPQALVDRLGDRLNLLKGGARDAPERQRALRDTILWSYELLSDGEQRLLELLAVFSGMTVDAVEDVARRAGLLDGLDVLDGLGSLVGKSLVRQVDVTGAGPRLSMLESIRAFAEERLSADPELHRAVRRAHAEHFADWTLDRYHELIGDERDRAAERMAADIDNLHAAWHHWVAEQAFDELGKLTDGLWLLYDTRGWYRETTRMIRDLLDVLSSTPSNREQLQQLILLQVSLARVLLASEGYTPETERAYERALELCEVLGEYPQMLPVLRALATFHVYRSEFERSASMGEQLLALATQVHDEVARVEGHAVVGASNGMLARFGRGLEHLEQGIAAYGPAPRRVERFAAGNDPGVVCRIVEAMLLWMRGSPDRAREVLGDSVDLAERLGHPQSIAYAQFHTGLVHMWLGEPERAVEHATIAMQVGATHGFAVWTAAAGCLRGAALAATGQADEGLRRLEAAMERYRELQSPPVFWPSLLQLHAVTLGLAGRRDQGVAQIDEAIRLVGQLPEPQTFSSELLLVKAGLLAGRPEAEAVLVEAAERADQLEAPMLQLRATLALARLWVDSGRVELAADALGEAYERFTEGFDTVDLTEARRLLDELAARSSE